MIRLQNVFKCFGGVAAVRDVTLEVAAGGAIVLTGPSGSGKTTVLRLIAGLEVPDRGRIMLNGHLASDAGWACPPHERGVGMVFQTPALWPHLTVAAHVAFALGGLSRPELQRRLHETVRLVRLEGLEGRYPDQLSGGEAQRVALARAIAPRPAVLLLDEPMTGLDQDLVRQMAELIRTIRGELGTTVIYVTHHLAEAAVVTDRIVMLRAGEVARMATRGQMRPREGDW
jgi:ABC-type Fe3+/spermidine/putrescine transport system ATPase subunit